MSKKSQEKGLSPYFTKLATQMLMPSMAGNGLVPSPNSTPSQVSVRKIRKTFVVKSSDANFGDGFTVAMFPDLFTPGYITSKATVLIPDPPSVVQIHAYCYWEDAGPSMQSGTVAVKASGNPRSVSSLVEITDAALVKRLGFNLTPLAATSYTNYMENNKSMPVTIHTMYKVAGGNWTILTTDNIGAGETLPIKGNLPANTDAIAYVPVTSGQNTKGGHINCNLVLQNGQYSSLGSIPLSNAFEPFVIDNGILTGRVISMSLLVRNTSPEIANGGNICAGRVPCRFNPISNVFQEMSVLPENRRYQGPAATGAYASWMPSQFDEFEIDNIENKRETYLQSEYIIIQINGWAPPVGTVASASIECEWCCEFFTPNQVFEKVLTPPRSEEFEVLFHILLSMPAATCNPEHGKLLKELLRKGGESVKSGLQYYDKNKATINTVLSLMLKLLV